MIYPDPKSDAETTANSDQDHRPEIFAGLRSAKKQHVANAQKKSLTSSNESKEQMRDIRVLPFSPLDAFVVAHCTDMSIYRRTVTKLFISQRFACGLVPLVTLIDLLIRIILVWSSMKALDEHVCATLQDYMRLPYSMDGIRGGMKGMYVISAIATANAVHIWRMTKGI